MTPKPKKVNIELIDREERPDLYELMDELIAVHHEHLVHASIALVWREGWKKDKDGRLTLGQCRKASDLDRRLHEYDFVLLLNKEIWNGVEFSPEQKRALLDHELCHAEVDIDEETGETRVDEDGRTCFRIRKHDIEEFTGVVARHGLWRKDLERFAQAVLTDRRVPLFVTDPEDAARESARELAKDPVIRRAIENLRPKKGEGINSIIFSTPGHAPVALRAREDVEEAEAS